MRAFWIAFGVISQAMFAVTVGLLFLFLWGINLSPASIRTSNGFVGWIVWDMALLCQFAVSHSILLLPSTRKRLSRFIPSPQYGVFFCFMTCLSLWATILLWKSCPMAVWDKSGIEGSAIHGALIVSWLSLFYSISLTGFGYQTGWTTWWAWFRRKKIAPRQFASHGAYRFFRHPIYLSFMGLIWSNPSMTADRFVLAVVWTIYIFIGSELKDRRLEFYIGDAYRSYRKRIPAYPWNANPRVIARTLVRRTARNSTHS